MSYAIQLRAFSSEVDTGSREENASEQKPRASIRFNRIGKGSSDRPPLVKSAFGLARVLAEPTGGTPAAIRRPLAVANITKIVPLALMLWLTATAPPAWSQADRQAVVLGDAQPFTKGSYFAFLAPFNAGSLVSGKDYIDRLVLQRSTFPDGTNINWQWPNIPCPGGIYNFNSVQFGNYYNTHPNVPIPSKAIIDIVTLIERYDLALGGSLDDFDVITDFFLTSTPGGDSSHAFEVEIFIHTPPYSIRYADHSTPIGTYVDASDRAWRVVIDNKAHDVLFMPVDQRFMQSTTVDIKAMLRWLVVQGTLAGNEYFNGLGIGVEVRQNEGSLAINSFSVTYE